MIGARLLRLKDRPVDAPNFFSNGYICVPAGIPRGCTGFLSGKGAKSCRRASATTKQTAVSFLRMQSTSAPDAERLRWTTAIVFHNGRATIFTPLLSQSGFRDMSENPHAKSRAYRLKEVITFPKDK